MKAAVVPCGVSRRGRFTRFVVGGGAATAAHWALMLLLIAGGMDDLYATGLGALLGAMTNYFCQYRYTFASRRAHADALPAYALVAGLSMALNTFIYWGLTTPFRWAPAPSQLITTATVCALNYFLYKTKVFHE